VLDVRRGREQFIDAINEYIHLHVSTLMSLSVDGNIV
jgi:hypothetical protein